MEASLQAHNVFYSPTPSRGKGESPLLLLLGEAQTTDDEQLRLQSVLEVLKHPNCWDFLRPHNISPVFDLSYQYLAQALEGDIDKDKLALSQQGLQLLNYGLKPLRESTALPKQQELIQKIIAVDISPEGTKGVLLQKHLEALMLSSGLRYRLYPMTVMLRGEGETVRSLHYLKDPDRTLCDYHLEAHDQNYISRDFPTQVLQCPGCISAGEADPDSYERLLESPLKQQLRMMAAISERIAERLQLLIFNLGPQEEKKLEILYNRVFVKALAETISLHVHASQRKQGLETSDRLLDDLITFFDSGQKVHLPGIEL